MSKIELYRAGLYSLPVPPVHTTYWTEKDWINFIDKYGRWHHGRV